jgi:alanine racemase
VHLKVDTGMARVGVPVEEAASACARLSGLGHLALEGISTHIAWEPATDPRRVRHQLDAFDAALKACGRTGIKPGLRHAANSAVTLGFRASHLDMVRVGLLTYGLLPTGADAPFRLRPAMAVKARLVQVRNVPAGTAVSYGGTYTASAPARLAVVPVGYADGYSRRLSNRGQVLVRGRRCPIRGAVCMDQTVIDVTGVPDVAVGDVAVLLGSAGGDRISVGQVAGWIDGIPHQVVSQLGARLPRVRLNAGGLERGPETPDRPAGD